MAITDLTGTTWYVPSGWSCISNYGYFKFTGTFTNNNVSFEDIRAIRIGYAYTSVPTASPNSIMVFHGVGEDISTRYEFTSSSSFSILFTGGEDVTNADLISWLETNGTMLKVTDLTNTTWSFSNNSWTAKSGYGWYSVNVRRIVSYSGNTKDYIKLGIGYVHPDNQAENYMCLYNSDDDYGPRLNTTAGTFTLTFTGGADVTDTSLIAWLSANGELQEENKPTKKFTRLYIGNIVATAGSKCFKRLGTEIIDTVVSTDEFVFTWQDDDTYSVKRYTGTKTNVIIPSECKGKKVSRIGAAAFINNKSITSVVIPDSVTSIGTQAFDDCSKLANVKMSKCLTRIEYGAFSNCGFSNIEIPDTVTYIGGWAINICQNLRSLIIPKSVVTLGECVVRNCTSLKTIYCEATSQPSGWDEDWKSTCNATVVWGYTGNTKTITAGTYKFKDSGLTVPTWTEQAISFKTNANSYTAMYYRNNMLEYSATDYSSQVYSFGGGWIYDNVSSITIPSDANVTEEFYNWFSENTEPPVATAGLYDADDNLVASWDTLVNTYGMDCTKDYNLSTLYEDPASPHQVIANNVELKSAVKLVIDNSVTSTGEMAFACLAGSTSNLTTIEIPRSLINLGDSTFYGCNKVTSIKVDDGNTAYKSIDGNLYTKDGKMLICYAQGKPDANFTVPAGVTNICEYAIHWSWNLKKIIMQQGVIDIGEWAFSDCFYVTEVTIPRDMKTIGEGAFANCSKLANVYYAGTEEEWKQISIGSSNTKLTNATIHYNYVPS